MHLNAYLTDRVSITKLHGDIRMPGQCILSKNQYDQAYGEGAIDQTRPIPKLLEYYYKNSSLLFLGCSLNNDRTVQVFRAIKHGIQQKYGDIVIPGNGGESGLMGRIWNRLFGQRVRAMSVK